MALEVIHGDCLAVLPTLGARYHAAVTDPPYHLTSIVKRFGSATAAPAKYGTDGAFARASAGFMGKQWDGGDVAFRPETWRAVYDVMLPGGWLVAMGGARTFHRLACAIEDAGFEIRDCLMFLYGSGFPKSHNLDGEWSGWGTALKPAFEPIILARKPLVGTVAQNVLAHGCGALNIDASRVATEGADRERHLAEWNRMQSTAQSTRATALSPAAQIHLGDYAKDGRWPANVLHDGSAEVEAAFAAFGSTTSSDRVRHNTQMLGRMNDDAWQPKPTDTGGFSDNGTASRFFTQCPFSEEELRFHYSGKADKADRADSSHPTIKPLSLISWLCRLITPPGGRVLDPFAGSGGVAEACMLLGFDCTLIEKDPQSVADIRHRIRRWSGEDLPLFQDAAQ